MSALGKPRKPAWSPAELEFLRENYSRMSNWSIGQKLGRSSEAVRVRAAKLGLQYQIGRPFTSAEDAYIREHYEVSPMREMVEALSRHHNSIRDRARQLGLVNAAQEHRRAVRATVRHDYFSRVDTPVKAYVLGLLASDGTISSADNGISIKAKPADAEVVRFVRDELSPKTKLGEYTLRPLPGYTAERPYVVFAVGSAQLKADLARFGITPRKSFTLRWPALAPHLVAAFVLGCYDGDGCLQVGPCFNDWRWSLYSASESFLGEAADGICRQTGLRLRQMTSKRGLHELRLDGKMIASLDSWLHADVPGMTRKRLPPDVYAYAERQAVIGRAEGCRRRYLARYSLEELERASKLRAQGHTLDEIVAATGISRTTVWNWTRRKQADPQGV